MSRSKKISDDVGSDMAIKCRVQRNKKAFFSDQCKEIEENNRMGKTRDLFSSTEVEDIKNR